ncbi:Methyltransferase type 11, partial [Metarhizium majus ARSEF 297]
MDKATLQPAMETGPEKAKTPWQEYAYSKELPDDIAPFKELLQHYSKVPPDEVDALLVRTRDRLWNVVNYPCIGLWTFTNLPSTTDSRFEAATQRLLAEDPVNSGGTRPAILDVGCCIGQILRQLAYKGVHPSRLYGTDLHPEFIHIGNELFGDEQRGLTFVAGDMLHDDRALKELDGKVTMIHAAYFFHLFTWDDQVRIGERMVRFLQPGTRDAVIFGRHIGTLRPREMQVLSRCYLHNRESFQRLWDEVGNKTGTRWRVEAEMVDRLRVRLSFFGDDEKYMSFGVYQM